jgi:hypothetical protein
MVVFPVGLKMLSQLGDTLTQKGNLNLWRARIGLMHSVLVDYLGLLFCRQSHARKRYSSSVPNLDFYLYRLTHLIRKLLLNQLRGARPPEIS